MTGKTAFAGTLGGMAIFVWWMIAHVATPLGEVEIKELPNEPLIIAAVQLQLKNAHGLYVFPGMGLGPQATRAEKRAAMSHVLEKMNAGPSGLLLYHDAGHGISLTPDRVALEFLTALIEGILVTWLLTQARLLTYARKVCFVVVVGIVAAITTNLPYYTWYGFPRRYTAGHVLVEVVGYLCAGLVIAALINSIPKNPASSFE